MVSTLGEVAAVNRDEWTAEELEVIAAHRWWSRDELSRTAARPFGPRI
jgi:hypothetical protein